MAALFLIQVQKKLSDETWLKENGVQSLIDFQKRKNACEDVQLSDFLNLGLKWQDSCSFSSLIWSLAEVNQTGRLFMPAHLQSLDLNPSLPRIQVSDPDSLGSNETHLSRFSAPG